MTAMTLAAFDTAQFPLEHGPRDGNTVVFIHGGSSGAWTWTGVLEHMPTHHALTPDLAGFGERYDERWPGLAGAADDIAALIRERAVSGRAHVVGLSLGGFVAIHLAYRRPELVRSCTISGSALTGYSRLERAMVTAQMPLWRRRSYWAAQSPVFRIPKDSKAAFITTASRPSRESNSAMIREIAHGAMPRTPFEYTGSLLAVAAQHDTRAIAASFPSLRAALPQTRTWIAPGMFHAWSAQDPAMFARMVAAQVTGTPWPPTSADARGGSAA